MRTTTWILVTAATVPLLSGTGAGCGPSNCPPVECNIEGLPELADEALACASRAVDGGNGVAYWLLPLSPVVVSETGVLPYVVLAANTSDAPVSAMLADATGTWFFEAEGADPVAVKQITIHAAPAVEAGPGQQEFFVGTVGLWGEGVPNLADTRWSNLRLELTDGERTVSLRLRLPIRADRRAGLDNDCWRAIMMHRERPVREWASQVIGKLLRDQAED